MSTSTGRRESFSVFIKRGPIWGSPGISPVGYCPRMKNRLEPKNSFALYVAFFFLLAVVSVSPISGLRCYQCGQYTDGPGSITPCINYTDTLHLKQCPPDANKQCVKYVNEASTVRDCADECTEKRSDSWGTSIYCCSEDACNLASFRLVPSALLGFASILLMWDFFRA